MRLFRATYSPGTYFGSGTVITGVKHGTELVEPVSVGALVEDNGFARWYEAQWHLPDKGTFVRVDYAYPGGKYSWEICSPHYEAVAAGACFGHGRRSTGSRDVPPISEVSQAVDNFFGWLAHSFAQRSTNA